MIKVALVGAGGIAEKHAQCLAQLKDVEIAGVYDVNMQRASALAASYGATAYSGTDLQTCIDRSDAVYILTPPVFHKEAAILAMRLGRAVFIEKPIATSLEDAEQIVEAVHKHRINPVVLGFNMRFREGYKLLKQFVDTLAGQPLTFWSQRFSELGGGSWRTDPNMLSGFTIESLSHDIDLFQWLSGSEIESVYAKVANSRRELDNYDDNANVILQLKNEAVASIQASWSSSLAFNSRGIIGTEGDALISGPGTWDIDTFRSRRKNWSKESIKSLNDPLDTSSYSEINRRFIDCVIRNEKSEIDAEYGFRILQVSHSILRSSQAGQPVVL